MKYTLLLLVTILVSCSSKMIKKPQQMNLIQQISQGQNVSIKDETITEALDFTQLVELIDQNNVSKKALVKSNLYFQGCTFTKPILGYSKNKDFSEITTQFQGTIAFINCKFESEVNLKYATFYSSIDFSNSTFKKKINFQDATFMQRLNFRGAFCQDEAHFQNSRFYHKSNFMETKFNGHLMFQGVNFRDEVNFSLSECLKYVDFSLVKFDHTASFNYIKWPDRAVFNNSTWLMNANFIQPKFGDISFKNSDCRGVFLLSKEDIAGEMIKA